MVWEHKSKYWIARGKKGKFYITKKGQYYCAEYIDADIYFQFPYSKNLGKVKDMCEKNYYWSQNI